MNRQNAAAGALRRGAKRYDFYDLKFVFVQMIQRCLVDLRKTAQSY
jgi:hypothetical protein